MVPLLEKPRSGTLAHQLMMAADALTRESVSMAVHGGQPASRQALAADLERRRRDMNDQARRIAAMPAYRWE